MTYFVSKGKHDSRKDGLCAMEWVAYLAGEPHTDSPVCVSPVLTKFCISLNDVLPDDQRQKLRPYLARTIGTRDDGMDHQRGWLATDWLIREFTPTWLELAHLDEAAARLRALPPVLALENLHRSVAALTVARNVAGAAAGAAARDAVWDAVWAAAWDAAGAAARDAVWAAAGAAAWDAAGAAVRDAAGAAAWDALHPTVERLQASAFGLFDRMLPTEIIWLPVAADAEAVCYISDSRTLSGR